MRNTGLAFVLAVGVLLAAVRIFLGCGGGPLTPQDGTVLNDLSTKLAACRKEAIDAKDAGATSAAATMRYEDCKRREGITGVDQ